MAMLKDNEIQYAFSNADAERMHRTLVALDDYLKGFGDPLARTVKGIISHTLSSVKAPNCTMGDK